MIEERRARCRLLLSPTCCNSCCCPYNTPLTLFLLVSRGRYSGGEGERLLILQQAARLGADYVDVELKVAGSFFVACMGPDGPSIKAGR